MLSLLVIDVVGHLERVFFVIIVCEYAASLDVKTARRLAVAGCLITAVPVIWSSALVLELIITFTPGSETVYPHGLDEVFDRQDAANALGPGSGRGEN